MPSKSNNVSTDTPQLTGSDSPQAVRHGNADPTDIGAGEVLRNVGSTTEDADAPFPEPRGTDPWAKSH